MVTRRRRARTPAATKSIAKRRKSRVPVAAKQADAIDALVAASARALALPIDPAWQAGVRFHLQLLLTHAARLDEFPLADDIEPAPVFHA